ncbi:hypothetical protein MPTK1_2g23590 [Marchantia polymorpha subsp. ruderalis]|uniref:Uncharacterized protein n=1 Tax=Marchantia polymorpha TaxID=3197 RepID=A0A2R6WP80_MARPO|nr:hypothetical protein MARPO_0069s0008 [Marchantia polymorpha]BBN03454.1 hypothetical protein Mp_2g23590 [Marchantia polymorpha subsp. ruderalis]|eukprot:PTQ35659.1 hypothetical protein MARPO_0069s0008 [Marchantia polymorpha]
MLALFVDGWLAASRTSKGRGRLISTTNPQPNVKPRLPLTSKVDDGRAAKESPTINDSGRHRRLCASRSMGPTARMQANMVGKEGQRSLDESRFRTPSRGGNGLSPVPGPWGPRSRSGRPSDAAMEREPENFPCSGGLARRFNDSQEPAVTCGWTDAVRREPRCFCGRRAVAGPPARGRRSEVVAGPRSESREGGGERTSMPRALAWRALAGQETTRRRRRRRRERFWPYTSHSTLANSTELDQAEAA